MYRSFKINFSWSRLAVGASMLHHVDMAWPPSQADLAAETGAASGRLSYLIMPFSLRRKHSGMKLV
jgi:hypothetical protein